MRTRTLLLLALIAVVVAFYGVVIAASESGEVVVLHTKDEAGNDHATRLWVVDYADAEWVRTGAPEKGWFRRAEATPEVVLERGGVIPPVLLAIGHVLAEE